MDRTGEISLEGLCYKDDIMKAIEGIYYPDYIICEKCNGDPKSAKCFTKKKNTLCSYCCGLGKVYFPSNGKDKFKIYVVLKEYPMDGDYYDYICQVYGIISHEEARTNFYKYACKIMCISEEDISDKVRYAVFSYDCYTYKLVGMDDLNVSNYVSRRDKLISIENEFMRQE